MIGLLMIGEDLLCESATDRPHNRQRQVVFFRNEVKWVRVEDAVFVS